jgi:2-polyprenyl-3-methyl-5-hydroxy-6-metoxy-1,4-benzoquinol methylase
MQPAPQPPFQPHDVVWTDEKVARLWDYYAKHRLDDYFAKQAGVALLHATRLPRGSALEVLDFGCGPGFMWDHMLAETQWNYTGLDFSRDSVEGLVRRAAGHARFRGAHWVDHLPSPLPADSFDAVLLLEVVEHLNDEHLSSTLREVVRVLKPGGALVVSTPNEEELSKARKFCPDCGATFHEWQHVRNWSAPRLEAEMTRHGLRQLRGGAKDFSMHGFSRANIETTIKRGIKRALGRPVHAPTLYGVFAKPA